VLQGRDKAIVVQQDGHLVALGRYIVVNPVRAGLVAKVGEWPWSSDRATGGHRAPPAWLTVEWLWAQLSHAPQRAVRAYRQFHSSRWKRPEDAAKVIYQAAPFFLVARVGGAQTPLPAKSDGAEDRLTSIPPGGHMIQAASTLET
jgi:hypothetical protein